MQRHAIEDVAKNPQHPCIGLPQIYHVQQPCDKSCLPACVAMIIGQPVELILQHFPQLPAYEIDTMKCLVRFGYLPIEQASHYIPEGGIFIVTVPSLNRIGQLHAMVVDTRRPGQHVLFDPQAGRGGEVYTLDNPLPVCSVIQVVSAYEVSQ